jgi:hypothetical protein
MKSLENLVLTTSRSLQINEAYQAEIQKMETFLNELETRPNLTEAEKESLSQSRIKIAQLKDITLRHKAQIKSHLEEHNLGEIFAVAEAFNGFIR